MTEPVKLTVSCPDCGEPMVQRNNSKTRHEFLGCSAWPDCEKTMPVPAYVALIRAGAERLPGFDAL